MTNYRRRMTPGDLALTIGTLLALGLAVSVLTVFLASCDGSDLEHPDEGECEPQPDPDEVFHEHCVEAIEARCQLIWETECVELHGFDLPVVCMPDRMKNASWLGEWCEWMGQCGIEAGYLYLGCVLHRTPPEHAPAIGTCWWDLYDDGTPHIGVGPYDECPHSYLLAVKSCL